MSEEISLNSLVGGPAPKGRVPSNLSEDEIGRYIKTESGGNPNAVSPKGAEGLMQVMPGTQVAPGFGVRPAANKSAGELKRVGVDYLSAMKRKYGGDPALTAIAYNMGPGATDKWLARGGNIKDLPKETRDYVKKIGAGRGSQGVSQNEDITGSQNQTVSLNALTGEKTSAKGEEKFNGQRLLMNAAAAGDVALGIVPQVLGVAADAATYATNIALGKPHDVSTKEGRESFNAVNEKLGNPLRRLLDHFYPDQTEAYDDSAVNKAMTKVSSWLDKGVDKVVEKTDGRVSKQDAETMRDWLMVMGPIGVGKVAKSLVGKAAGDVEKTGGINKELVEKYSKAGAEKETPQQVERAVGEPPPAPGPRTGPTLPPPEKAPPAPIGQAVGAEAKTRLIDPPIIGEKPESAPSGPPIETGAKPSLDTGLEKVRSGKMWDLTAEERIALKNSGPSKLTRQQGGKADPALLLKIAAVTGGAYTAQHYADQDKLEAALAGGLAGLAATKAPQYAKAVGENWKRTMGMTAGTGLAIAGGAYLDKEHPIEGALLGMLWGTTRTLPKSTLSKINNMTIDDQVNLHTGQLAAQQREISNVSRSLRLLVPEENRRAALADVLESGNLSSLKGDELTAAQTFRGFMDSYGSAAKGAGIIEDFTENYVTHIVEREGLPKTKIQETMQALFGPEEKGGAGGNARFGKERKYETFADLQQALQGTDLKLKTKNIADIVDIYGKSMGKAIENKMFIDGLKNAYGTPTIPYKNAYILPMKDAPVSYKSINHPQMRGLMVHPELAPSLKFVLEPNDPTSYIAGLTSLSLGVKRINTSLSLFHASNLINAYLGAMGVDALKGTRPINAALKMWKEGGAGDALDYGIRGGLVLAPPMEMSRNALQVVGQMGDAFVEKATGIKQSLGAKGLGALEKVQQDYFDKATWDYLHTGMKAAVFTQEFEKGIRNNPKMPKEQVARQVASYVNDTFGGLDWYRVATETQAGLSRKLALSALSPKGRNVLQIGMFAPDWTFSTFRSLYKALPGANAMPLTQRLHQKYVLRTALMYATLMNGYNMAVNEGKFIWENKNRDGSPDPLRIHYPDGTTQQVAKHATEGPEWLLDPRKTALNKLGFAIKEPAELLLGKEYLTPTGKAPAIESRVGHVLRAVSPIGFNQPSTPGRGITDIVKRAALSTVGLPVYGMTNEEIKAAKAERATHLKKKKAKQ